MISKASALSLVTPKRFLADLSVEHLCWAALIRVTAGNAEGLDVVPFHHQQHPKGKTQKLTS